MPETETVSVYHWINVGAYTCDACSSMETFTVDLPESEHPDTCDCDIREDEIDVEVEYGDVHWEEMGYSEDGRRTVSSQRNGTDRTISVTLDHSISNTVSVSVSLSADIGVSAGELEASIGSSMSSTVSSTTSVGTSVTVDLEPGEEASIVEVAYEGDVVIYADRQLNYQRTPLLDYDIEGGISQVGDGTFSFKGAELEID